MFVLSSESIVDKHSVPVGGMRAGFVVAMLR